MGSGQTKDGFIDMFLETTQQVYQPGSYVEGIVHINCKDNRNYSLLQLRLKGVEHVQWSEGSRKHRRHYKNTKDTYNSSFQLAVFAQRVFPGGHYSFPFKFLLPSEITGTLFESQSTYIRYQLISQLIPSDDKNDIQTFVKNLNIIEPCREVLGAIQKEQFSNPECCCCKSYGIVKVSISCDKNFVRSGDKIHVTGVVDNSAGKQKITNCQISFQDIRWKISCGGAVRQQVLGNHPLFMIPTPVQPGQRKQFSFSAIIPQALNYSTAIGSIVSRFHTLTFTSHMGCCSVGPNCQFLLVFNSGSQVLEVSPQVPPPPGWRPKLANKVLFTNFPPFHYQPNAGMPYLNRSGMTNVTNLAMMNNQMGYYQNQTEGNTLDQLPRLY